MTTKKAREPRFVVQLHRARHLHYDFRLEIGGALASWAVPKGPSLDPGVRRLAIRVEDHPLDYYDFEGRIEEGRYGAGEVIVWDAGTYELLDGGSAAHALRAGRLEIGLHGEKLRGAFALVRMRPRAGEEAWLLIKQRDAGADRRWRASAHPASVLTGRTVKQIAALTNPEKVLWPGEGLTKHDLVAYYERVAPAMLPYLRDRALMLERYPDGIAGKSFIEKHVPAGADGEPSAYVVCNDRRTLLYLANLAAITLHVWQSRLSDPDRPDLLFFDLDPTPGTPLRRIARVAVAVRDALSELGLRSRVKTSGSRGLHVLVRLREEHDYADVRRFAELVALRVAALRPDDVTLARTPAKRPPGTVYLDAAQVGRGKTMAAPFSVRAQPGAPVSMPLDWDAVEGWTRSRVAEPAKALHRWSLANAAEAADPWRGSYGTPQRLGPALAKAQRLWKDG